MMMPLMYLVNFIMMATSLHTNFIKKILRKKGIHGVAGIVGMILTGIFADYSITNMDIAEGTLTTAGWLSKVWIQVPIQLAAVTAAAVWSFAITYIIGFIINKIPGLKLRCTLDEERVGLDHSELGEKAYEFVNDSDDLKLPDWTAQESKKVYPSAGNDASDTMEGGKLWKIEDNNEDDFQAVSIRTK